MREYDEYDNGITITIATMVTVSSAHLADLVGIRHLQYLARWRKSIARSFPVYVLVAESSFSNNL